jgi:hypothetical protein
VCWTDTLLNNADYVETPDGYCSQACTSDADCGTGICYAIPGVAQAYCVAQCFSATTCRHPGYACTYQSGTVDGQIQGICFPDSNLTCSPTAGNCNALLNVNGETTPGGCIRAAYEDEGVCHIACQVGTGTCPADPRFGNTDPPQHCVFINATVDASGQPSATGDKWDGPVCLDLSSSPTPAGSPCTYFDQCQDGYQCDRYGATAAQRVCRRLCAQGNGMQDPTLYSAPGGMPFTNACPSGVCTNELQAGTGNGAAGLCVTP